MLKSYLPALVFIALGTGVGGLFTYLNRVLGPRRPSKVKEEPYECGLPSEVTSSFRFGISCCAIEMISVVGSPRMDAARFGAEVFRASPRQADMIILSGRVSVKMAPIIRRIYDQMLEPKWVISMGACASSAGMFNNYALVAGADKFLPVDVYVPGCPPRPEALMYGIIKLQNKIKGQPDLGRRDRYHAQGTEERPGGVEVA